jgi:plasmid stabilization system protein ParE
MSYTIVNRPLVYYDILEIVDYYKEINTELAVKFLDQLEETKKYILDFPESFQIRYNKARTILIENFPYHIHYLIDNNKKQIIILAIIHSYKNPKDYSKR